MIGNGITYSRVVAFLKVVLPLTALALLSTLFLISNRISDSTGSIPFAKVDLEQRAREQQITAPFFSGRTKTGHLVAFTAEFARPDPENPARSFAGNMDGRIDLASGSRLTFSADTAAVNSTDHKAVLDGDVILTSSNGYTVRSQKLISEMRDLNIVSEDQITGEGPAGTFVAGRMDIKTDEKTGKTTLFFTNGVKLIYTTTN